MIAAIVGLLGKPESRVALHPPVDVAGLSEERTSIRAALNGLAADRRLDAEQVAIMSEPLHERLRAVDTSLATASQGDALAGLAGEDSAEERWFALSIERQRAVAQALLSEVRLFPSTRRGRPPKGAVRVLPESVRITWTNLVSHVDGGRARN